MSLELVSECVYDWASLIISSGGGLESDRMVDLGCYLPVFIAKASLFYVYHLSMVHSF